MNRAARLCALVGLMFALCGFTSCQRKPDMPDAATACPVATEVQVVHRPVYVSLPDRVTAPVPDLMPAPSRTYGQAVEDADRRAVLLDICHSQLREARWLGGTPTE